MLDVTWGIVLVAVATSLGWSLRGEWGHWWGATVPGAFCGMTIWLVFGESSNAWQMLSFGAVLACGLALGGTLSYGRLRGYIIGYMPDSPNEKRELGRSPVFGLFGVFLVGGMWGFFGGVALGLLLTKVSYGVGDLALWAVTAAFSSFLTYKLLVVGLDLHLSPPRSDAWAPFLGTILASAAYFALGSRDFIVLRTAFLGWLGFGGGFVVGCLFDRKCQRSGSSIGCWKIAEHVIGFFGGLGLAVAAALEGQIAVLPVSGSVMFASSLGVLWLVPYMNISDTFEMWYADRRPKLALQISRKTFTIFQAAALVSLLVVAYLLEGLIRNWNGNQTIPWLFLAHMFILTLVGIAKFLKKTRKRFIIYATIVAQAIICAFLALIT